MKNNEKIKVGVIGTGPVGMILSAHLVEAGFEVAICEINRIAANLIKTQGTILEGAMLKRTRFENVFSSVEEFDSFLPEYIFVCVKATHLPGTTAQIAHLKNCSPKVICAMNGIDVEKIAADILGESRVFRMVINFAGNLTEPNTTKVSFFNPPNYLASVDDSGMEEAADLAESLSRVGLYTVTIDSFELIKRTWEKTILNASLSALCAIGRMTMSEVMNNSDSVELVEQIIVEAVEVAEAEKIRFEDDFIRKCLRYLTKAGNHFPSLAVDLLNGRPTEIDFMNGKIVEYGRKHYLRTSLNLTFTNMVKAMSRKQYERFNLKAKTALDDRKIMPLHSPHNLRSEFFLGVDLGSAYTKFSVINHEGKPVFHTALKTLNREKIAVGKVLTSLKSEYNIKSVCATGYGRKHFADAEIIKTELNCAAKGATAFHSGAKNIIDIGGEDIKIIKCAVDNSIENFYLNDKCAAGTGSFIIEVAERVEIRIEDMSEMASKSHYGKELNSFCTVFAKTEIMSWLIEGLPVEDIARGIYISILNRVLKLKIDPSVPVFLVGGVIAYHPYLREMLAEKLHSEVSIIDNPQFLNAYGAALYARDAAAVNSGASQILEKHAV